MRCRRSDRRRHLLKRPDGSVFHGALSHLGLRRPAGRHPSPLLDRLSRPRPDTGRGTNGRDCPGRWREGPGPASPAERELAPYEPPTRRPITRLGRAVRRPWIEPPEASLTIADLKPAICLPVGAPRAGIGEAAEGRAARVSSTQVVEVDLESVTRAPNGAGRAAGMPVSAAGGPERLDCAPEAAVALDEERPDLRVALS